MASSSMEYSKDKKIYPFTNKKDYSDFNKMVIVRVPEEFRAPGETKYQLASLNFRDPASSMNFPADKMLRKLAGIETLEDQQTDSNKSAVNSAGSENTDNQTCDNSVSDPTYKGLRQHEFDSSPSQEIETWISGTQTSAPVWQSSDAFLQWNQQPMPETWTPQTRRPNKRWRSRSRQQGWQPSRPHYNPQSWQRFPAPVGRDGGSAHSSSHTVNRNAYASAPSFDPSFSSRPNFEDGYRFSPSFARSASQVPHQSNRSQYPENMAFDDVRDRDQLAQRQWQAGRNAISNERFASSHPASQPQFRYANVNKRRGRAFQNMKRT